MTVTLSTPSTREVTSFGYTSDNPVDQPDPGSSVQAARLDGGGCVLLAAQTTVPAWGNVVTVDTANADSCKQQPTTSLKPIGVAVGRIVNGRPVFGPNSMSADFGHALTAGERVFIQRRGIVVVVADGAITKGAFVDPSSTTAGYVTSAGSATVGQTVGIALTASTTSGDQIRVLLSLG